MHRQIKDSSEADELHLTSRQDRIPLAQNAACQRALTSPCTPNTRPAVQVCFFDEQGNQTDCINLRERTAFVWHGLGPRHRCRTVLRVSRRGAMGAGEAAHRFNAAKLLVDPYAEAICGKVDWKAPIFAYKVEDGNDLIQAATGMMHTVCRSRVVVDHAFNWGKDCPPQTPLCRLGHL